MKRTLYLLAVLGMPIMATALEASEPQLLEGVYALKISPNGKWLGSRAGDASIYNLETGENVYYNGSYLGLGNCVSNAGVAVGSANDVASIMYNGETIVPESLDSKKFWFCDLNAITPDGTRITGIINNPEKDGVTYVPFVATVDADLNVGEPLILPYPKKDFFGGAPQYCTAVWISFDGKTIAGQVQDWRGMYSYPIYYKETAPGEWKYELPTESLFNPTGIEMMENPWFYEPVYPEPADYMSGSAKAAYEQAYEVWANGGGFYPDPFDGYLTEEQAAKYLAAAEAYNNWYYNAEDNIRAYIKFYQEILKTSPSFSANDMAMHPSGDYFMLHGGKENDEGDMVGTMYNINTLTGESQIVDGPSGEYFPCQILNDGTLIITKGIDNVPSSFVRLPGSEKFITMQEYFGTNHPEISEWLDATVPGGTGVVCMSEDRSVITGALIPDQLANYDDETSYYYNTYLINVETAGVESILDQPQEGIYTVYNLNGVKVMETKDANSLNELEKGIYIINGKKIIK